MLDWTLTTGPLPIIVLLFAAAGLGWLLFADRGEHWWSRRVPIAIGVGLLLMVAVIIVVQFVWRPFPDALPLAANLAVFLTGAAVMLAALQRVSWPKRLVSVLAVVLVALGGGSLVNNHFADYLTVRQLIGLPPTDQVDFNDIARPSDITAPTITPADPTTPTESTTPTDPTAPTDPMPAQGSVTETAIPGATSGFPARNATIYLPPAYGFSASPLPVLVMMAGQPGSPQDWLNGGQLPQTMDAFAAQHDGVAPVVAIVDQLGTGSTDPMCLDTKFGNAFAYLSVDVPDWITKNLIVDTDHRHWGIGGLSSGGTCSLQLAGGSPEVYSIFIDLSGEDELTYGSKQETIDTYFGGDEAAWQKANPLTVISGQQYPNSSGVVGVGADDTEFVAEAKTVVAATKAAGMDVQYLEVPGAHTFDVWAELLRQSLPLLAAKLGLPS